MLWKRPSLLHNRFQDTSHPVGVQMENIKMNAPDEVLAQRVGPAFSVDGMLLTREKTLQVVQDIAARVVPGMVEEDAVEMGKQVLIDSGLALTWHPTRVRFGINTIKPMKQASVPGVVLKENDIFFIDLAPRFQAW